MCPTAKKSQFNIHNSRYGKCYLYLVPKNLLLKLLIWSSLKNYHKKIIAARVLHLLPHFTHFYACYFKKGHPATHPT